MKDVLLPYSEKYLPFTRSSCKIMIQNTRQSVMKFFEDKKVNLLTWPPQSSDLNPLENVLGETGRALNNQKCKSLKELYENVQKFWCSFPKQEN